LQLIEDEAWETVKSGQSTFSTDFPRYCRMLEWGSAFG